MIEILNIWHPVITRRCIDVVTMLLTSKQRRCIDVLTMLLTSKQRCIEVVTMLLASKQRRIYVEITSCAYWEVLN